VQLRRTESETALQAVARSARQDDRSRPRGRGVPEGDRHAARVDDEIVHAAARFDARAGAPGALGQLLIEQRPIDRDRVALLRGIRDHLP
jgi:hypothetical protein